MASATTPTRSPDPDATVVDALRTGDDAAFGALVARHHTAMVAVAMRYVHDRAVAEDVTQETWIALWERIDTFEGRSSLKTWLFAVLTNRARSHWRRQVRVVPGLGDDDGGPAVGGDRFRSPGDGWPGHWSRPPMEWDLPAALLEADELRQVVAREVRSLPAGQHAVITLRDIEEWTAAEVCEALDLSPGNQRVLLHRARSRVRAALDCYMTGGGR
ncbi:MAG TPA: RNA polymerase sigma factor [Euzebyales bacterium]|nr:RNA polymerase sigma factor [Euzebyales bacterium]